MAIDKKISQLTNGAPAQAADEYVVARGAANYKLTLTNIAATMPPIGATTPNTASFTTLTTSSTVTLNGGTANGVLYLNGSKVATSGSALVFDGTNLGIGRSPSTKLDVEGQIRGLTRYYLQRPSDNYSLSFASRWDGTTGSPLTGTAGINMVFGSEEAGSSVMFATGNVERARIDSSGNFGVGVTTVNAKIEARNGYIRSYHNSASINAGYGYEFSTDGGGTDTTIALISALQETASARTGAILFQTANSGAPAERARITSGGDIQIRTADSYLYSNATSGGTTIDCGFQFISSTKNLTFWTNNTERARITAAGNLAIGTTTAATKVQIFNGSYGNPATSGTTQTNGALRLSASGTTGVLDFGIGASGTNQWIQATDSGGLGIAYNLLLNPNGGNVGIGTTSPANKLSINQGSSSTAGLLISGTSSPQLLITETATPVTGQYVTDTSAAYLGTTTNHPLVLRTNTTERARITSGGDFCVGVTSGYTVGGIPGSHSIVKNGSGYWACGVQNSASSSPYGLNIYYGGVTPNGTGNEFLYCHDSTALRASIRSNGGISNYQANDVNLSDKRVKTDIKPVGSYWDKIKAIEIVTFKYKDQTHDDDNVGVIAQQVESVAPEFVDVDGFGETPEDGVPLKTIYTTDMYHAAIKALQEAMARIEQLEAKVAALESK